MVCGPKYITGYGSDTVIQEQMVHWVAVVLETVVLVQQDGTLKPTRRIHLQELVTVQRDINMSEQEQALGRGDVATACCCINCNHLGSLADTAGAIGAATGAIGAAIAGCAAAIAVCGNAIT